MPLEVRQLGDLKKNVLSGFVGPVTILDRDGDTDGLAIENFKDAGMVIEAVVNADEPFDDDEDEGEGEPVAEHGKLEETCCPVRAEETEHGEHEEVTCLEDFVFVFADVGHA